MLSVEGESCAEYASHTLRVIDYLRLVNCILLVQLYGCTTVQTVLVRALRGESVPPKLFLAPAKGGGAPPDALRLALPRGPSPPPYL